VKKFLTLAILTLSFNPALVCAQTFDLGKDRQALISLDGLWRFHTGDDPAWANADFNDSSWPLLHSDSSWSDQGYEHYRGFAWYRFRVNVPPNSGQLAIGIPRILTSYQVFADGRVIGEFGGLPPQQRVLTGYNQVYAIPVSLATNGRVLSVAIRVWHYPYFATYLGGGPVQSSWFGKIELLQSWKTNQGNNLFWETSAGNVLMLINILAAITGFALFASRRTEREYLWFGIYEFLTGVEHLVRNYPLYYPISWHAYWSIAIVMSEASWVFFLFFVFRILNLSRNWLYWMGIATVALQFVAAVGVQTAVISNAAWDVIWSATLVPYFVCILMALYQGTRRRVPDAQLLLVPVGICYVSWFTLDLYPLLNLAGQIWIRPYFFRFFELTSWPFPISVQDIADLIMLLSIVAILPMRFARTRRDEQRFAGELEAARTVQQVLIPADVPEVPGLAIRSVYEPAGFVGGDFFQVIPIDSGASSGSVLIVIGDVSGKGMPAAMTVSLLVGTFRTLAHYTQSPAEILAAMNQRMIGRNNGGFTTCLVLFANADGALTIANAGHIAPYLSGKELQIENGLPLGLAEGATYAESIFQLAPEEQLTLMTDGVVEAREKSGELFGFERTAAIVSRSNAEGIAQAAKDFGQDDDITVVSVTRLAVPA
jgi:hypothetical protein